MSRYNRRTTEQAVTTDTTPTIAATAEAKPAATFCTTATTTTTATDKSIFKKDYRKTKIVNKNIIIEYP